MECEKRRFFERDLLLMKQRKYLVRLGESPETEELITLDGVNKTFLDKLESELGKFMVLRL